MGIRGTGTLEYQEAGNGDRMSAEPRELFHEIFDNLIVLLLEYQNLDKVLQSNTYEEFIEAILERRFYGNI